MRPLIGITSSDWIGERGKPYHRGYAANAYAIADAGGLPVYIPTNLPEALLRDLYERLDGLLLPGGPDVDPAYYGADRHAKTIEIDLPRDELELTITRWAYADDLPIFGICRGHQVLNVALGGTLIQDIPSEVQTLLPHETLPEEPREIIKHDVTLEADSRIAAIMGRTSVGVNSLHHQASERIAPGLVIAGISPDGIIEAAEAPDKRFVLSVQWHPEDLFEQSDAMRRLFAAFVAEAQAYAEARTQTIA